MRYCGLTVVLVLYALIASQLELAAASRGLDIRPGPNGGLIINGKHYKDIESAQRDHPGLQGIGRGNAGRREQADQALPTQAAPSAAARRRAANKAMSHLATRLQAGGLEHPSGSNGQAVTYALAGLAFLASGSTLRSGPYKTQLTRCVQEVLRLTGQEAAAARRVQMNIDQRSWAYAHALLFLSEVQKASPSAKVSAAIKKYVTILLRCQTGQGSWCHSLANEANPLGYREFNAVGTLCLTGLGLARQLGHAVPEKAIDKAFAYVKKSSNELGGVGYSVRQGQQGFGEAGRTAGAFVALVSHERYADPFLDQLHGYLMARLGQLEAGHASPILHVLNGALASHMAGAAAWERYWGFWGATIIGRQRPDGSFRMPVEKRGEGRDRSDATQALVLVLPESQLRLLRPVSEMERSLPALGRDERHAPGKERRSPDKPQKPKRRRNRDSH